MMSLKNFWAHLGYWWFVITLIFVGFFTGSLKVKAETTANFSSVRLDVYQCKMDVNVQGLNPVYYDCVWDNVTGTGSTHKITFGSTNGHLQKIQVLLFGGSNVYPAGSYNLSIEILSL